MRHDCSAIQEVSIVLRKDGCVCLLRRFNAAYMNGKYCFPAGHKEPGETPIAAVIREAQEEVGVRIDPAHVRHIHTMHRLCHGRPSEPDHERVALFFAAEEWHGEPFNAEPDKSDHVAWFPLEELPDMIPYMRHALEQIRAGVAYSEFAG